MEIDLDKMLEPLRQKVINKEHLEGLWQGLAGETGEYRIGKQTLFLIVDAALRSLDGVKVRPLEWVDDEANSPIGRYAVRRTEDGYEATFEWEEIAHVGFNAVDFHYGAKRAAKDHAEAYHQSRVLAALV